MNPEDASVPMLHASTTTKPGLCRDACEANRRRRQRRHTARMPWRGTLFSLYNYLRNTRKINDNFRLVSIDGQSRIQLSNVPGEQVRYLLDIFTTVIDTKWRYIVLLFFLSYCLSWALFGSLWYLITVAHDSLDTGKLCVDNVDTWTSAFLFSVETQSTIGYGGRQITPECPSGVFLLVLQTLVGMLINCAMLGLIFAKMSRPKNRAKTVLFSCKATVTRRNDKLCLCFQVMDIAKRRLFDCNIRAFCVRETRTVEGEVLPFQTNDLQLTVDQKNIDYTLRIFPLLPLTLMHIIDDDSPLNDLSEDEVKNRGVEIVVVLEGTVPTTGMVTQAVTSYTAENIEWGYTFLPSMDRERFIHGDVRLDVENLSCVRRDACMPRFSTNTYRQKSVESECSTGYDTESRPNSTSLSSLGTIKTKMGAMDVVISVDGDDI